jgi:hypothetical protein
MEAARSSETLVSYHITHYTASQRSRPRLEATVSLSYVALNGKRVAMTNWDKCGGKLWLKKTMKTVIEDIPPLGQTTDIGTFPILKMSADHRHSWCSASHVIRPHVGKITFWILTTAGTCGPLGEFVIRKIYLQNTLGSRGFHYTPVANYCYIPTFGHTKTLRTCRDVTIGCLPRYVKRMRICYTDYLVRGLINCTLQ